MKNYWITKLHSLLGITAGIVLCVVGITGGIQSFEEELLRWMNPEIFKSAPARDGLPLKDLYERVQRAHPDKRVVSWQVYSTPGHPVRVGLTAKVEQPSGQSRQSGKQGAAAADSKPKASPRPPTEFRYHSIYNGGMYPFLLGESFFRTANDIHRRLAAGDIGKQIVGASVLCLAALCLSGLYLRWPHNPLNWRNWLKLDFKLRGRKFLRDLHMITGTWLLLLYLLSALTGLYWSYDWYKNGLHALTGTQRPVREVRLDRPAQTEVDIEKLWQAFLRESGGRFHEATLRFPERKDQAAEIRYLDANPVHNRAYNRLFLNPDDATVVAHERHAEKPVGGKLMAGLYPLHTGRFFGFAGILLMMTAAWTMPLFAITGWTMYLDRHRREHAAAARGRRPRESGPGGDC